MENNLDIKLLFTLEEALESINTLQSKNETLVSKASLKDIDLIDSYIYIIAKENDEPIGYIIAKNLLDFFEIQYILVDSNYRNKNVASSMIKVLENYAKENEVNKILLEVRRSNQKAISLYEKNGFKNISVRKNYYSVPIEDALIYERITK